MEAARRVGSLSILEYAREIVRHEARTLDSLASGLNHSFLEALDVLAVTRGAVLVTGMGKAGLVGQKISATFCSTGTRSFFLHPADAIHGDLGRIDPSDVILALSMSGETEELTRVLPSLVELSQGIVAITSHRQNTLARSSRVVIELGPLTEACGLGLAPSTTTTAMMALGDALALSLSERRGFGPAEFAKYHPGGSLGRKLTQVQEMMRPLSACRVAQESQTVREVFVTLRRPGRRTGAVMIVNSQDKLVGLFTDSDLARLLENQQDAALDRPVQDVMTQFPCTVMSETLMPRALALLTERRISELPVVDQDHRPVGLLDITDIIGWVPPVPDVVGEESEAKPSSSANLDRATVVDRDMADRTMADRESCEKPTIVPFRQR